MLIASKYKYSEYHKEIEGKLYKKCADHIKYFNAEGWFPCTEDYYYINKSNQSDGFHPICKKCSSKKAVEWKRKNVEHVNEQNRIARIENKWNVRDKMRENSKRRRNNGEYLKWCQSDSGKESSEKSRIKRQNKNHKISESEWNDCKNYFNNSCAYCGLPSNNHYAKYKGKVKIQDLHKEHVDFSGASDLSNCVPSCRICNSEKHTFKLDEWYNNNNSKFSMERYNKILKWITEDYKLYIQPIKDKRKYEKKEDK